MIEMKYDSLFSYSIPILLENFKKYPSDKNKRVKKLQDEILFELVQKVVSSNKNSTKSTTNWRIFLNYLRLGVSDFDFLIPKIANIGQFEKTNKTECSIILDVFKKRINKPNMIIQKIAEYVIKVNLILVYPFKEKNGGIANLPNQTPDNPQLQQMKKSLTDFLTIISDLKVHTVFDDKFKHLPIIQQIRMGQNLIFKPLKK
jgi:hypothetical protein